MRMLRKGWENLNPVVWRRFDMGRIVVVLALGIKSCRSTVR